MGAKWIWYNGEFELYHNIKLHTRREHYGMSRPAFWDVPAVYHFVEFGKDFVTDSAGSFLCRCKGDGLVGLDDRLYPMNTAIPVEPGAHSVSVKIGNPCGLPSIYIDSDILVTDETWRVTHGGTDEVAAACIPAFTGEGDDPQIFPFAYQRMDYAACEKTAGGLLFDFGREMFGKIVLSGLCSSDDICVCYGESREEALAPPEYNQCMIWENISGKTEATLIARAFRYIRISGSSRDDIGIHALYEYLPLDVKGSFSCNEEIVGKIWDMCAYTFHLCSREFYLDGIKRDRWVWSGDARQSFMINNYLFADRQICKRTILSLLPKDRVYRHVNTINDYSALLIISAWEYYMSFDDPEFIAFIWPRLKLLYDYIVGRLDENGFVEERENDWIFIDWSPMDKSGPLAAEQILLWQTQVCMAKLSEVVSLDGKEYTDSAESLKNAIFERFWREDSGAFIDSFVSGKNNITRHANIFAILFDFVDAQQKERIYKNVLCSDSAPEITTPYFKLYELMAICSMGHIETAQELLDSYWGGMIALGATSVWEEYDPQKAIPECYEMYGEPYAKSLCHAWSCGPIYFLGRYCLGVSATEPAYKKYTVKPNPGNYTRFQGDVPTESGNIHVEYQDGKISVLSQIDGGTLIWKGSEYPINKNELLTV